MGREAPFFRNYLLQARETKSSVRASKSERGNLPLLIKRGDCHVTTFLAMTDTPKVDNSVFAFSH